MHVADMSSWLSANAAQTRASVHGGMSSSRSVSAVYTVCIDVALDDWYSAFAFLPSLRDNIVFVCALSSKGFIELCANGTGANNIGTSCCAPSELPGSPPEASTRTFNSPFTAIAPRHMIVSAARRRALLGLSILAKCAVISARLASSPARLSSNPCVSSSGRHFCAHTVFALPIASASSSALVKSTAASFNAARIFALLFVTTAYPPSVTPPTPGAQNKMLRSR
mmetsp:Transcript_7568/g.30380  ORF Transcript_7568/g.30380 Transcript_7568/m.30380 type:complete len:225 (-) Transcript_7568:617-1291(-)